MIILSVQVHYVGFICIEYKSLIIIQKTVIYHLFPFFVFLIYL